jgi:hypothetical protein
MLEKLDPDLLNLLLVETPERSNRLRVRVDRETGDFVYILAADTNNLVTLNRSARDVFEMCDGNTPIRRIAEALHERRPERTFIEILEEVVFFVRDMQAKRVLFGGSPHQLAELGVEC